MFKDLVLANRSYRGFDESRAISREELLELVSLARCTPSGANNQPLKYRLVYQHDEVETVVANTKWAAMLPNLTIPHHGKHPTAFIAVCVDTAICAAPANCQTDVGIASQTMLLAAVEKGLGGCMIANFKKDTMAEILHLPEGIVPALMIALGKPDEKVVLVDAGDSTKYYRDENDVHYVPKRTLESLII